MKLCWGGWFVIYIGYVFGVFCVGFCWCVVIFVCGWCCYGFRSVGFDFDDLFVEYCVMFVVLFVFVFVCWCDVKCYVWLLLGLFLGLVWLNVW